MSTSQRLNELLQQREEETRSRLDEVEREWELAQADLQMTRNSYEGEIAKERQRADALDSRVKELRDFADRLASSGAPVYAEEDVFGTPLPRSPSASNVAYKMQKAGGKSYTEIYTSYIRMQEELTIERAESQRLSEALSDILAEIQNRAPLLKEQRAEYERSTAENNELSVALAKALDDKDNFARLAESQRSHVDQKTREAAALLQQLEDASQQMRNLTRRLAILEDPTILDRSESNENGILQKDSVETANEYITNHLLTFRSVDELQSQNRKLLKIVRELGKKMEEEEEAVRDRVGRAENEAVEEAHELILRLKDEVEMQRAQTGAYLRERDMLRQLLRNRGNSTVSEEGQLYDSSSRDDASVARLALEDVQKNFEAYKREILIDNQSLRDDLTSAHRETSQLQIEVARAIAKKELMEERFKTISDTNKRQSKEIIDLSRRNMELQGNMARQDDATRQVMEEVLDVRSNLDRTKHEAMILKAEREVWKVGLRAGGI